MPTVLLWRKRFESDGIAGIFEDRPRSGGPKRISAEQETAIAEATMKTAPKGATQWSVRAMAAAQKSGSATVQRIWKKHKLQPRRMDPFKFSKDPPFARKVRDIVGLCMTPFARQSQQLLPFEQGLRAAEQRRELPHRFSLNDPATLK